MEKSSEIVTLELSDASSFKNNHLTMSHMDPVMNHYTTEVKTKKAEKDVKLTYFA